MNRFSDLVTKPARDMTGYFPMVARPQVSPASHQSLIKLDSNENPFGPSPRAIEAIRAALGTSNFYPDDDCSELRGRLASLHAMTPEQVLVTAGSTEMLALLCHALLEPGRNAVTSERSFVVYGMAVQATGAELIQAPMRNDEFDLNAIRNAINPDTRIVFVANPNNPTGTMLDAASIDRFMADVPRHVVVVLDEAYYDFAARFAALRKVQYPESLEYVRRGAGVVVLRTFSKAHGLAGLRVGYGVGPVELLAYCARMRNTFPVSSVAQAAALAALDDSDHIVAAVSNNTSQAQVLTEALAELGHRVLPTAANFLYCDVGEDAAALAARLRGERISVRPLGPWGAPHCLRVTIGTPEQNRLFLAALVKIAHASRRTKSR